MKNSLEDPRNDAAGEAQPGEQEFLTANAHVPDEIGDEHADEFKDVQSPAAPTGPAAAPTGWTAEEVANIFAGCFMLASLPITRPITGFGGEHWSIADAQCQQLGRSWLPVFQKHIPYDRKPGLVADLFMWIPAIGALKTVCEAPIKKEIELFRQKRQQQIAHAMKQRAAMAAGQRLSTMVPSPTASMATATRPA